MKWLAELGKPIAVSRLRVGVAWLAVAHLLGCVVAAVVAPQSDLTKWCASCWIALLSVI